MDDLEWMQYGIDKGYVSWFCLNHDGGFSKNEKLALDDNDDICVNAFRLTSEMEK